MIMIMADGAIGFISLIAGFIILAGDVSLVLLTLVCVARAVGQAFHSPAMMATMPMLVPTSTSCASTRSTSFLLPLPA